MVPVAAFHDTQARTLLGGAALPAGHNATAALRRRARQPDGAPQHRPVHWQAADPAAGHQQPPARPMCSAWPRLSTPAAPALSVPVSAATCRPPWQRCCSMPRPARRCQAPPRAGCANRSSCSLASCARSTAEATATRSAGGGARSCASTCSARPRCSITTRPITRVPATTLVGPAFGIHNANAALQRVNFVNYLLFWDRLEPGRQCAECAGHPRQPERLPADAADPAKLVDRLSLLALGEPLPTGRAHRGGLRRCPVTRHRTTPAITAQEPRATGRLPGVCFAAVPDRSVESHAMKHTLPPLAAWNSAAAAGCNSPAATLASAWAPRACRP